MVPAETTCVGNHQTRPRALDDGSRGGNPNVGGFSRHLRDCASSAIYRLDRVCNVREFLQTWGSPKGIPWLRTLQRPRVIIRSSLLSLVSWRKVRGSAWETKSGPTFNIQSLFEIQWSKHHLTLIFVPFSGFQFPIIRSVVTIVFARRSLNTSSISSVGLGPCAPVV